MPGTDVSGRERIDARAGYGRAWTERRLSTADPTGGLESRQACVDQDHSRKSDIARVGDLIAKVDRIARHRWTAECRRCAIHQIDGHRLVGDHRYRYHA